jgi:hypothetical protein
VSQIRSAEWNNAGQSDCYYAKTKAAFNARKRFPSRTSKECVHSRTKALQEFRQQLKSEWFAAIKPELKSAVQ